MLLRKIYYTTTIIYIGLRLEAQQNKHNNITRYNNGE